MFSHFSILSLYMPHGKYDSFSTLYCLCTCFFVSVMFSFPNRDVPINCFAELKKSLPSYLHQVLILYLKTKLCFKAILKEKRDNDDKQ